MTHTASYVGRPSSGRIQALCRKHSRTDSGFVLLVFHILKWEVDVVVKCRKFTKSSLLIHDCLRAIRAVPILTAVLRVCVCVFLCGLFWGKTSHSPYFSVHTQYTLIWNRSMSSLFKIMPLFLCICFLLHVLQAVWTCLKRLICSNNDVCVCVCWWKRLFLQCLSPSRH